jgi:hypothetical protein
MTNQTFVPEGFYRGRVVSQQFCKARTGTRQLKLRFLILDDVDQGYECDVYLALTTRARDFTERALQVFGFNSTNIGLLNPNVPGHISLVGRECDLECRHQIKQGRAHENWYIHSPHQRQSQALDANDMADVERIFAPRGTGTNALPVAQPPSAAPSGMWQSTAPPATGQPPQTGMLPSRVPFEQLPNAPRPWPEQPTAPPILPTGPGPVQPPAQVVPGSCSPMPEPPATHGPATNFNSQFGTNGRPATRRPFR